MNSQQYTCFYSFEPRGHAHMHAYNESTHKFLLHAECTNVSEESANRFATNFMACLLMYLFLHIDA